jgi:hypothetical protein
MAQAVPPAFRGSGRRKIKKGAGTIADPIHKEKRRYCFTGALDDAAGAAVFEAFTAFLLATLFELTGFAVVDLADFLPVFFFETGAGVVDLVVELCGVTGALDCGVLCANIAAAVNIEIRIVRFIFVFSLQGAFDVPLQIHLAAICFLEH